jgi:hypothetical protein
LQAAICCATVLPVPLELLGVPPPPPLPHATAMITSAAQAAI